MGKNFKANTVINGTWGEMWLDSEYMAEVKSVKASVTLKYSSIERVGTLVNGQKLTGLEPKGEVKLHKVSSRISEKINQALSKGKAPSFLIITNIADPDSNGSERVALRGCKFDKLILADWEAGKNGEESYSLTLEDWEYLDMID